MDTKQLKKYAPEARRDFIEAVANKAAVYGLLPDEILPMQEEGDVIIIGDRPFPRSVAKQRKELEDRIRKEGFQQFIEAIAYTWFNRFVAIRYMELHGYLDHGYRVLSHPDGKSTPEILENAERIELPSLNRDEVVDLKLDGGKDEQLYQMLLVAQCNALHKAMPFLFESIKDGTELLLPDNLLHTDSPVRKLVNEIPKGQWENIEIIGWLYQAYISEKKDEVIGKVVKSEDIPAATQLFTPNWIVRYMLHNTLGRKWLATNPDSPLREQMVFYIEPAKQTAEIQQQLDEITPDSLNPEELTLLDPACGSGHILVEAYDLFKSIYAERGYRARDIPKLILTKNLFGLEIDDRAAQLAAFALMMKARADDRSIFEQELKPHVLSIQESKGLDAQEITDALNEPIVIDEPPPSGKLFEEVVDDKSPLFSRKNLSKAGNVSQNDVAQLIDLFENGKMLGALIELPDGIASRLSQISSRVAEVIAHGAIFDRITARVMDSLLKQSELLSSQYAIVVANPPYMGSKYFTAKLKAFIANNYKHAKADLYACFIQRNLDFAKAKGFVGMITIPNWMFLSSFEALRKALFERKTIDTFIHNGRGVFGSDFGSCSFVIRNHSFPPYRGVFRRLFDKQGSVAGNDELEQRFHTAKNHTPSNADFLKIPGGPVAYWVSSALRNAFASNSPASACTQMRQGLITGDDSRFVRLWHEVCLSKTNLPFIGKGVASNVNGKWFAYAKGGALRRWYGNLSHVVNWEDDGKEIKGFVDDDNAQRSRPQNIDFYFREGSTWSRISVALPSFRLLPVGCIFSDVAPTAFSEDGEVGPLLAFLNSNLIIRFLEVLSPTTHFETGQLQKLPINRDALATAPSPSEIIGLSRLDWDSHETSWDFATLPVVQHKAQTLQQSQETADAQYQSRFARYKELEEENNRHFIEAYGLQEELSPSVPNEQITLYRPDRMEDTRRLLSYTIGCMMGRYSLDEMGLIYANGGNEEFDSGNYTSFPADEDGIVPITETAWFADDAANRFEQFVKTSWPEEHLEDNLEFVAESLGRKRSETSRECIRRYLATGVYKHHLAMYKKRPIYWLFSSGKQRAFQCLVYLHRYNAGTLSRMRTEYVVKLQGKINSRIEQLEDDIPAANSTSHRKKLEEERDKLITQRGELQEFDEKLRHYADQRIELDLDDGVKVNYGKFGDLLAEVKAITGEKPKVEVTT